MLEFDTLVLSRRVRRPPELVGAALADLPTTPLEHVALVGPFERRVSGALHPAERIAPARLCPAARVHEPIEIEVGPWSVAATEIRFRPMARRPQRWSARRLTRYFRDAHAAADELVAVLERTVSEPVRTDVRVSRSA
jgi:hypothetical protein